LSLSITTPSGVTVSTNKSVWVGVPSTGTTSEDIYWRDGSYIEVSSINDADRSHMLVIIPPKK